MRHRIHFARFLKVRVRSDGDGRETRGRHSRDEPLKAMRRILQSLLALSLPLVFASPAAAQTQPATDPAPGSTDAAKPAETKPSETNAGAVQEAIDDPQRRRSAEPKASITPPSKATFDSDPIADGAIIGISLGAAGLLSLINGTGEVRPQQVPQNFDRNNLLGIDRGALSQNLDKNAATYSSFGLYAAVAFAVVDPILTGFREDSVQAGLVDAIMYAETMSLTYGITNFVKVAVRRPRPNAYLEAEANKNNPNYANTNTDSSLSFFSGHASLVSSVGATATYLAFARSKSALRPVITLILATAVTTFTSVERVRAGEHFPTDVIAGSIAGAGVGIIVPHLHRSEDIKQRRMWVGFAPVERGAEGGSLTLSGYF